MPFSFIRNASDSALEAQLRSIAHYRRSLSFGKLTIAGIVALMILGVGLTPLLRSSEDSVYLTVNQAGKQVSASKPVMKNPHFESIDARDQPYTVRAKQAIQEDSQTVSLQKITADIAMQSGLWVALTSDTGRLNMEAQMLQLKDNVQLFANNGYEFHSSELQIQLRDSVASTNQGVRAHGPLGTIHAQSFQIEGKAKQLRFTQNVKLVIYP